MSLLWVSKSLSAAALNMPVKGVSVSAFLQVSLETANILERVSVDAFSSTGSEV